MTQQADRVGRLARNDIAGVIRLYLARRAAGTWTAQDAHVAFMLQDEPQKLAAALAALPPLGG